MGIVLLFCVKLILQAKVQKSVITSLPSGFTLRCSCVTMYSLCVVLKKLAALTHWATKPLWVLTAGASFSKKFQMW